MIATCDNALSRPSPRIKQLVPHKLAPSGFAVDHMLALNSERTRAGVVIDRHKLSRLVAEGALAVAASVWYTITIERVAGSDGKLAAAKASCGCGRPGEGNNHGAHEFHNA